MNERIKDFYDQVGLDFENFQRVTVTKGDMEKFAELIVRECNQAVSEVPLFYQDYRSQIEAAVIRDCARAVLERFGVEE